MRATMNHRPRRARPLASAGRAGLAALCLTGCIEAYPRLSPSEGIPEGAAEAGITDASLDRRPGGDGSDRSPPAPPDGSVLDRAVGADAAPDVIRDASNDPPKDAMSGPSGDAMPGPRDALPEDPTDAADDRPADLGEPSGDACVRRAERCDGVDEDCDGRIDERLDGEGPLERPCPFGPPAVGVCRTGAQRCRDGAWEEACEGTVAPAAESGACDGLDEDCDGRVDESAPCNGCPVGVDVPDGWVCVPPGERRIGALFDGCGSENAREREVVSSRPLLVMRTELRNRDWGQPWPSFFTSCGADCPVEQVSWFDAVDWLNRRSLAEGLSPCHLCVAEDGSEAPYVSGRTCQAVRTELVCDGWRLPTEAEWEIAARGGTRTDTFAGDLVIEGRNSSPTLDDIAWYGGNSEALYVDAIECAGWPERARAIETCGVQPVGGLEPNPYGLYDVLGNVAEWTADHFAADPPAGVDPITPRERGTRVYRGGAWDKAADQMCVARRRDVEPGLSVDWIGLRPVRTVLAPQAER